ncbi:MAG: alpha/beta fold hydrolase [Acidimicrobiales bacterium]
MSAELSPPRWFVDNEAAAPTSGQLIHDGVALRWFRWGPAQGPPLVLVHGAAANHAWWSPIAPLLAERGPVVAMELSGMGDSGWREDGYLIEQWADEVSAVLAAACPGADISGQAVLVGHSLGASVAAAAAVRQPQQWAQVVLCDLGLAPQRGRRTAAVPSVPTTRAARVARHFTNRILYRDQSEALAHFSLVPRQPCPNPWMIDHVARHSVRPVGPGGVGDQTRPPAGEEIGWSWKFDWRLFARRSDRPLMDYLSELGRWAHTPNERPAVICLNGALSRVATAEVADRITELAVPNRTVWVADAAHHLMLDQPLAFVSALRDCGAVPSSW